MSLFRSLRICNVLYSKKPRITGSDREAIATIADVMVSDRLIIACCNRVENVCVGIDRPLCEIYGIDQWMLPLVDQEFQGGGMLDTPFARI